MDPAEDSAMEFLSPRQYNSCPAGTLFYDCSYPYVFSGCCANNACADGVCLPQFVPSSVISSEIASGFPPGAVTPFPLPIATSSPSTTSVTSTPPAPTSSPSPSDTTPDSTPPSTTTIPSSSTVPPTTTPSPSITSFPHPHPRTSNNGAIAGGVVGGVAAVALLLFLLWFCLRRRKRQQSLNTANLHRSVSAEALGEAKTNPPVIPSPSNPGTEAYFLDGKPTWNSSTAGSVTATTISRPESFNPSLQGAAGPSDASTCTSVSNTNMDPLPETNELPASIPETNGLPASIPETNELPASIPERAGFTPELSDTGVYQPPAELAANNQSELINQRRKRVPTVLRAGFLSQQSKDTAREWDASPSPPLSGRNSAQPSPGESTGRKASPVWSHRKSAQQVVTPEGVVLGANLDHTEEQDKGKEEARNSHSKGHVMSFMSYENEGEGVAASGRAAGGGDGNPQIKIHEPPYPDA